MPVLTFNSVFSTASIAEEAILISPRLGTKLCNIAICSLRVAVPSPRGKTEGGYSYT